MARNAHPRPPRAAWSRAFAVAAAFLAFASFFPAEAFARGGFRGGGFRSAPSIRSMSIGRPSGSSRTGGSLFSWGSATRPAAAPSSGGPSGQGGLSSQGGAPSSRFAVPGTRSSVSAQRSLYDSARSGGTLFSSKAQAAQAFRTSYGSRYGSSFATEPQTRPDYIPSRTYVGGQAVNIVYNQGLGGYGYYNPMLGSWMLYDALADAAMLDILMGRHNYYYGPAPVYLSHGGGFLSAALGLFLAFMLVAVLVRALRMARGRW
ncbi:MAG TPA: hypothetical protein VFL04_03295 [Rectinemataceae bacterium]|nr:hypothetical protein [Rectinemataceae bacterium]